MNKGVLILGGIIVLAVITMFALKAGESGDKTQDTGSDIEINDAGGGSAVVQQPETKTQTEPTKTEVIKSKIEAISLSSKTLGPEETVEAFWTAIMNEDYEIAMGYFSKDSSWPKRRLDLVEEFGSVKGVGVATDAIKYENKKETVAKVHYEYGFQGGSGIKSRTGWVTLQKENNEWKIVKAYFMPTE